MDDNKQALKVYDTLCGMLDNKGHAYDKNLDKLEVLFGGSGDDLQMDFRMWVDAERSLITLDSILPFQIPEDKAAITALAVAIINNHLRDGNFDYVLPLQRLYFRSVRAFEGSLLSAAAIEDMLNYSIVVVDDFNDKLLMVCKGSMDLQELLDFFNVD